MNIVEDEEKMIKHIFRKFEKEEKYDGKVNISKNDVKELNMEESDAVKILIILESDGYIKINRKSNNYFSNFWIVTPLPMLYHHFDK